MQEFIRLEGLQPANKLTIEGFTLEGYWEIDEYYDESYLGKYSNTKENELAIETKKGNRFYKYFNPYEAATPEEAQMLYERASGIGIEWEPLVLCVKATKNGINLGLATQSGIESDSNANYMLEVYNDLATQALNEAKETLKDLINS